jgi:hypothetical protein
VRNCASICACFPSLHNALGLQRFDILFAQSLSAKDLGVVLAELGGDRTHTDAAVDLDQGADVRDVGQFGVGGVLGAMARSGRDADSSLEEAGFEPSVPRDRRFREGLMSALLDSPPTERRRKREPMPRLRRGLPRDRWFEIQLPPAGPLPHH